MKKRIWLSIILAALLVLCAFALCSCSGEGAGEENGGITPTPDISTTEIPEESTAGLAFSQNADGTYKLVGMGECTEKTVVINKHQGALVTGISEYVFIANQTIETLVIGPHVKEVPRNAFSEVGSLKNIVIADGVEKIDSYAFSSCFRVENVAIAESVTEIGEGAFAGLISLKSINIPEAIVNIPNSFVNGATQLTEIKLPAKTKSIGEGAFWTCGFKEITLPETVEVIGNRAFCDCDGLESIVIPASVTSIGNYSFSDSTFLRSVKIEGSAKIGTHAFYQCVQLVNVDLGDVTEIGRMAFSGCIDLESIVIPATVSKIGEQAFTDCELLTIYCEAGAELSAWDKNWNHTNCPVVWGYKAD